mmetsp:Transcript_66970/g.146791  ORF Transcript_66970/g.146791 Transcript_66970/m.146791 type:complete len:207 (+) Transcript_66970:1529-2149(+)
MDHKHDIVDEVVGVTENHVPILCKDKGHSGHDPLSGWKVVFQAFADLQLEGMPRLPCQHPGYFHHLRRDTVEDCAEHEPKQRGASQHTALADQELLQQLNSFLRITDQPMRRGSATLSRLGVSRAPSQTEQCIFEIVRHFPRNDITTLLRSFDHACLEFPDAAHASPVLLLSFWFLLFVFLSISVCHHKSSDLRMIRAQKSAFETA